MKKVYMLGMMIALAACFAYAGSLSVPWYIDNANVPGKLPPVAGTGVMGIIYLHNNLEEDVVCEIAYYSNVGHFLGPVTPDPTTFVIPMLSTVAFRPCVDDPTGQEQSATGLAVPNRPTAAWDGSYEDGDFKKNGSIVVRWTTGGPSDVQGILLQTQNADGTPTGRLMQWGTLLPSDLNPLSEKLDELLAP
jgi:hypothetical protein